MIDKTWKNKASYYFGRFASRKFNRFSQKFINYSYVKLMKLDMSEYKKYSQYDSLQALFTRKLEKKRVYSKKEDVFISPADSLISSVGQMKKDLSLQIKGFEYSINELTGSQIDNISKFYDKSYINLYLAPNDYHRYHAPIDMRVSKAIHIPGDLYPVNFKYLRKVDSLFNKNERVILECFTKENKRFLMVFVGAFNVGSIAFDFDEKLTTNNENRNIKVYDYENLELNKADTLGYFKMGSTVLMMFEDEFNFDVKLNEKIKFTDKLGRY
ncbi:MAG: Phosphatidylserine decarboxylase (EC [uncultured Campylobacterales bacterium]|uniref:phosphatidylserine decarboxylase n=1 Tax=uncultured Campylobacterales bacterium TaxID=352960 RepID=A0A6S6RYT5_9BACT|nr:MAG: Phosphatidylserine decarboxylase (EC [uncultured Campylobacterales bacterium]